MLNGSSITWYNMKYMLLSTSLHALYYSACIYVSLCMLCMCVYVCVCVCMCGLYIITLLSSLERFSKLELPLMMDCSANSHGYTHCSPEDQILRIHLLYIL